MAKFSIEYKRTTRLAPYETLTIGIMEEFDTDRDSRSDAFEWCRKFVDACLEAERERLAPGE